MEKMEPEQLKQKIKQQVERMHLERKIDIWEGEIESHEEWNQKLNQKLEDAFKEIEGRKIKYPEVDFSSIEQEAQNKFQTIINKNNQEMAKLKAEVESFKR